MKLRNLPKKYAESKSVGRTLPRATAQQRGYDYTWQQQRLAYLKEHPWCVHCMPLYVAATVVDHVIPHRGDKVLFWDQGNWQSLCKPCHDQWKQKIENATSQRRG